jgi:hypothetical protein
MITHNDPASGINVRTYLAAAALAGKMAKDTGFSAADATEVVKAAELVIAELNKGSIGSTGSIGAATNTGNKTINVGTPSIDFPGR